MKFITVDGRIGKDAEVLSTKNGKKYVRFSLATDTYSGGKSNTEWLDVTCFDPFIVENRIKALTKGRYVIVNGDFHCVIAPDKNGKIWMNQTVTASTIEVPVLGAKKTEDEGAQQTDNIEVSTYTTNTDSSVNAVIPNVNVDVAPAVSASESGLGGSDTSEDLPF